MNTSIRGITVIIDVILFALELFTDYMSCLLIYVILIGTKFRYSERKLVIAILSMTVIAAAVLYPIDAESRELIKIISYILCIFFINVNRLISLAFFIPVLVVLSVFQTILITLMVFTIGWKIDYFHTISLGIILLCLLSLLYEKIRSNKEIVYTYSFFQLLTLNFGAVSVFFVIAEVQSYFNNNNLVNSFNTRNTIIHNAMLFTCILVCVILYYVGIIKQKLDYARKKADENEYLIQVQNEQIKAVITSEEKLRAFKHDLIAHLNALNGFASEGDIVKVKDYCDALLLDTASFRSVSYTGNPALDGVLGQLKGLADEKGVELDIKMTVPKEKKISDYDLCILVSNIIKNAIEANNSGGKVDIKAWPFNENLCIISSNTTEHPLEYKKGVLLSTKRDYKSPGYGMRNIQAVIDKYDGDFQIKSDGDLVKVEALV